MSAHAQPLSPDRFPLLAAAAASAAAEPGAAALPVPSGQGDPVEFTRRWTAVQVSVRAYFNSYLSDRSALDDCVQEVALLAWRKGPQVDDPTAGAEAFLGFCLACAKRVAMGEVRRKYRHKTRLLSAETSAALAETVAAMEEQDSADAADRLAALRDCLGALDAEPRRLLELRYASGDPSALQTEARSSGRTVDAIYKKLERLRTMLRQCVAGKTSRSAW